VVTKDSFKLARNANSDGLIKCLQPSPPVITLKYVYLYWGGYGWHGRQRQDSFSVDPNIYAFNLFAIY